MNCCQCQGIEEEFDAAIAERELREYRQRGLNKTSRLLVEAVAAESVEGLSLLDIGGGVGGVYHALLAAGASHATHVDASAAYLAAARQEVTERGWAGRVQFRHGDFVALADDLPAADVVTLDRVICCYDDMPALVRRSAEKARSLYGLVYPRHTWWVRLGVKVFNALLFLKRSQFRVFAHPTAAVDALVQGLGFRPRSQRNTLLWQVVVYQRGA